MGDNTKELFIVHHFIDFMYISREKLTKSLLLAGILAVSVAVVSVILSGINQFKVGSQLASINQVSNLSHVLVRQQANLLSLMLIKNAKTEDLVETLDRFAKEDFVLDANLYAPSGVLLAQSQGSMPLKARFNSPNATQQIVEPIFAKEDLVGFLRVTFDAQYGQTTQSKVNQLFNQLYGELIILVLAGGLIASSIHYYLRRKVVHIHTPNKTTMIQSKTQTQRFHSRRRIFRRK